jgi:hypothetical protein
MSGASNSQPSAGERLRHHKLVVGLVVLACLLAPLSIAGIWLRDQVVDENAYVQTVSPLSKNPAIDAAVADDLTAALFSHVDVAAQARQVLPARAKFLAFPLAAGLRDFTRQSIDRFLGTARFHTLWLAANRVAHRALVAVLEGKGGVLVAEHGVVSIDLTNVALAVRHELDVAGIHVFDSVPRSALQRRFVIGHSRWLARARFVMKLRAVAIAVPVLCVGFIALALGLSRRRRRTLLQTGIGLAVASAVAVIAVVVLRSIYLDYVIWPVVPRDAGAAFFDTVTRKPQLGLRLEFVGGLLLAAGAGIAGPSRLAARFRALAIGAVGGIADEAAGQSLTIAWVADNRRALRAGTVLVGFVLLLTSSHPTVGLLVKLGLAVLAVLAVVEILGRPPKRGKRA